MIADLLKMAEAFRAGVGAARAVMEGRGPVLVEDVLAAEGCRCDAPRVAIVHRRRSACGVDQRHLLEVSLGDDKPTVGAVLDLLAEEADRRDDVRRGPR